jgi:hypothetical protein
MSMKLLDMSLQVKYESPGYQYKSRGYDVCVCTRRRGASSSSSSPCSSLLSFFFLPFFEPLSPYHPTPYVSRGQGTDEEALQRRCSHSCMAGRWV